MVKLRDVAKAAGVSSATVSRHLAGQRVRQAEAVQAAVEALNFRPSEVARSLRSGVTRSVGVIVPDVSNPFFAAVVKGVELASQRASLNILLGNTDENVARERELVHGLVGRVDGVILAPAREECDNTEELRRAGVPIVLLDRRLRANDDLDCVLVDNEGGAGQAVKHLVDLGHERIGLISGPLDTTPGRGRHAGFVAAMEAAGLDVEPELVHMGDFKRDSGYQATLRLLGLPQPPTAVFAANNLMSMGALHALHDMSVKVPDELSIVGFDELELGELLSPSFCAISRPMVEQGTLAMRLLRNRIDGEGSADPRHIILDARLVTGGSCGPPQQQIDGATVVPTVLHSPTRAKGASSE